MKLTVCFDVEDTTKGLDLAKVLNALCVNCKDEAAYDRLQTLLMSGVRFERCAVLPISVSRETLEDTEQAARTAKSYHPFVASPGRGCSSCGKPRSAEVHDADAYDKANR